MYNNVLVKIINLDRRGELPFFPLVKFWSSFTTLLIKAFRIAASVVIVSKRSSLSFLEFTSLNHVPPVFLSFLPFFFPVSAVDGSGSVGSGQPLVNAMKTDSALIGGTSSVVFHFAGFLFDGVEDTLAI